MRSRRWANNAEQHVNRRCLSSPIGTQQSKRGACGHFQVQRVDSRERRQAPAIAFSEVATGNCKVRHGAFLPTGALDDASVGAECEDMPMESAHIDTPHTLDAQRVLDILIVSQMYPGPGHPDLGVFVADIQAALEDRGHTTRVVAVTRRGGGPFKHLSLGIRTIRAVVRKRPDVIYAHFLAPAGFFAAIAAILVRRPLVVTAHGRDVRNVGSVPLFRALTRFVLKRASGLIAVSQYLANDLQRRLGSIPVPVWIIDCGVDTKRFAPQDQVPARARVKWDEWHSREGGAAFLFVGSLDDRKNVIRLVEAFDQLGDGTLTLVGDGPLRDQVAVHEHVACVGRVEHPVVRDWIAACDVLCLPSTVEPFGQVLIEAMSGARSVIATNVGGPPEFVDEKVGALVNPLEINSIVEGMRRASHLGFPNNDARERAEEHDVNIQAERIERVLIAAVDG